jgi:hypothetical protein
MSMNAINLKSTILLIGSVVLAVFVFTVAAPILGIQPVIAQDVFPTPPAPAPSDDYEVSILARK